MHKRCFAAGSTFPAVLVLILGGTRSGKSAVAERMAARLDQPLTYVATGEVTDEDMAARIARHRARRPTSWTTLEVGEDLPDALSRLQGSALVDALGTWVAARQDFVVDEQRLCSALTGRSGDTIVVSDEVGMGVHPSTEIGRRFRDALGSLNTAVAEVADRVLLVVAGRVLELDRPADVLE
jgi:adenosyl cobinamide kinase/adenosyl cobinamide phosphate guanylyltransferase